MGKYDALLAAAADQPDQQPTDAAAPAVSTPAAGKYGELVDLANQIPDQAPAPAPKPKSEDRGFLDAVVNKFANGINVGAGPAVQAGLTTALSKVPWLRDMAAKVPGIDPTITNPDITYDQRRQAYKGILDSADKYHPVAGSFAELAGNTLATLATPEVEALQAASPVVRGAIAGTGYGALQGAGEGASEGKSATDIIKGLPGPAIAGGLTGGVLEGAAGKLLREAPEKADAWIVKDIVGHDRGTQPASATIKKRLADDATDVRRLVNDSPELKSAVNDAADGKLEALQNLRHRISNELETELEPRAGRYQTVDQAAEHGGVRVGDLVKHLDETIGKQDVGDAPVETSLKFWRDRIKDKWGTKDVATIHPDAQLTPGFSAQKALDNYKARLAEATPEERPTIEATIKEIEDEFGEKQRIYDPNAVVPTTRLRSLVTDLQTDLANAMGGLDEKTRYQKLKQVQKPVWDFLNDHLDAVAKRSPEAGQAVDEIRRSNDRLSALLNMQKVVDSRVNKATSNSMAGMRPAFGIRGAIHQAIGPGIPGVAAAAFLGHPAVAAGLALTTVAPGIKRSADKALAQLIMHAKAGSIPAKLIEEAIAAGVPRAVATQIASSAHRGIVNNIASNVTR